MRKTKNKSMEFDNIIRNIKKRFGQLIAIPDGYFNEVIVRFGEGGRRQEKILYKGMLLGPKDVEDILYFAFDQLYDLAKKECIKVLRKELKLSKGKKKVIIK